MIIHMQEVTAKGKNRSIRETLPIEPLIEGRRDVLSAEPLSVALEAHGEEDLAIVEGVLSTKLVMSCSRCLRPVDTALKVEYAERYRLVSQQGDDDDEAKEEDEDIVEVSEDKLDLRPYVEEAFVLSLPYAPLCSEACKGLCSQCGADLNERECGCSREAIDPRLAGLKDFFKS